MSSDQPVDSKISRLIQIASSRLSDGDQVEVISDQFPSETTTQTKKKDHRILKIIPWILALTFIFSFFFDFHGSILQIFGLTLHFDGILRILSVSGMIGFLTNWVAILMLFRPQHRRPLLGQGLIPAQKDVIAEKLSNAVNKNLINPDQIKAKLSQTGILSTVITEIESGITDLSDDVEFRDELFRVLSDSAKDYLSDEDVKSQIRTILINHIDGSFKERSLEKYIYGLYKSIRKDQLNTIINNAIESVPGTIYEHRDSFNTTLKSLPESISTNRDRIEEFLIGGIYDVLHRIDLKSLIKENLNRYDEGKLENLIQESTIDQLNYIKYLGAVLGVFGGLIIWNPLISFIVLGILVGGYFLADIVIFNLKKNS